MNIRINIITWGLVCIGWVASNAIGYYFGNMRYQQERKEQFFEEISVLIEGGNRFASKLEDSFLAKQNATSRIYLWNEYEPLRNKYFANKSRYQFLSEKYFGRENSIDLNFILSGVFGKNSSKDECEIEKWFPYSIVAYYEIWLGRESGMVAGEYGGLKWKMMKLCGMDIQSYIKEWEAKSKEMKNKL